MELRDVEAVLAHFHDDVVFSSPIAARLLPDSLGVVRGKEALRHYWTAAFDGALVRVGHGTYLGS